MQEEKMQEAKTEATLSPYRQSPAYTPAEIDFWERFAVACIGAHGVKDASHAAPRMADNALEERRQRFK